MACMRDGFEPGRPLDNGRYTVLSPLNHGSFGMVFAARDNLTGSDVAIKCITKPDAAASLTACPAAIGIDDRSEELAIHSRLAEHPNIVNLLNNFETENHQYMVLELCNNGDLYEAIRVGKGPLETGHVRDFMLELIDALHHLHSNGVFHRDIKPENIFLTSTGAMKLGDFGLATTETWSTEFAVGSDRYMAPEQYDASSFYGHGYSPAAADTWAIGIVLLNVLFQRNPFASPTQKDPLFADFAADRQSLFDVFPNMSQDTYDVLIHSLAIDPEYRSLTAVREAIKNAVSFTVDDESLDDFCTEPVDIVPTATAAREPLRTPSLTTAVSNSNDSFPWSSALLKTPQKATRQLSTIHDEDMDMFPGSFASSWHYVDADEASLASNLDSGLGMSYKSTKSGKSILVPTSAKPKTSFVGSLPISFSRPTDNASPYVSKGFSKSWSDLWDEDEEMQQQEACQSEAAGMEIHRVSTAKPSTPALSTIVEDGRGSVTPRQGLRTLDVNVVAGNLASPLSSDDKTLVEPSKPRGISILDKWSALGNFRRARQDPLPAQVAVPTPPKTKYSEAFASFSPFSSAKCDKSQGKARERAPSWRQGSPQRVRATSTNNKSQVWQEDNNWRDHKPPIIIPRSVSPPYAAVRHTSSAQQLRSHAVIEKNYSLDEFEDEWAVGGLRDLCL